MSKEILEKIANEMIKNFNFNYRTLNDAKIKICVDRAFVEYDAMSFDIYQTNLNKQERYKLYKIINGKIKLRPEVDKERKERLILKRFIQINKKYFDWEIEKKIGIEVTTFITEHEAVCHKIISDKTISNESIEKYKEDAIKKHGEKANDYSYGLINGVRTIGTRTMNIDYNKQCFVNTVNKKFEKYSSEALNFDKFIVLCSSNEIEIINEYDVKSFFDLIDKTIKRNITVGLLYLHNDKDVFCYDEMDF